MKREEARLRELGLWPRHGLVARLDGAGPEPTSLVEASRPATRAAASSQGGAAAGALGDIATLDWPHLESAIRGCQSCGLCRTRRQAVPGSGSRDAQILVVGEAPGAEEDQRGEPFVGRAGELLDQMLLTVGLDRRKVYIANVLKCRPPENRDPSPDEVAACSSFLHRQIALLQPAVILALGSFAARTLLGGEGKVGALRSGTHAYLGIPVVVSYHPAYLLRSPQEKLRAWEDLCRLQDTLAAAVRRPEGPPDVRAPGEAAAQ